MKQNKKMIVCFLTPALVVFLVMFLYPILRTIAMSFFNVEAVSDPISSWKFAGIENYQHLMATPLFRTSMVNMIKIWLIGGIFVMVISLLFAVILTSGVRAKSFWRAVIYVPNIINAVAIATMWIQYVFNKRFGLFHNVFEALGLENLAKIDWMNGDLKFWSLLIAFSFGSVGYFMLIWISGIDRIPGDYYEAATIDGAGKIKQFIYITLPLIRGVFKSCMTFWTISVAGFFVWSQMWASPNPTDNATITPVVYMFNTTFGTTGNTQVDAGAGAAVGILMAAVVLIVFALVNSIVREDDLEF